MVSVVYLIFEKKVTLIANRYQTSVYVIVNIDRALQ